MYLIVKPNDGTYMGQPSTFRPCYCCDDMYAAGQALSQGCKVYKLDSLTEIIDIEATYEEITPETKK